MVPEAPKKPTLSLGKSFTKDYHLSFLEDPAQQRGSITSTS